MTDIHSKTVHGGAVRIEKSGVAGGGVFIATGLPPERGVHFRKEQVAEIVDAISEAVAGEKSERVRYVNNTGGAANNYVGQFADVLSRNDECQMTYLKFADNAAFWVDNDNVQPPPPFPGGTTSTRMFVAGYSFEDAVSKVFTEAQALLLKKHKDYGPTNISASPGGALNGLRVRIHDKVARINHLIDSGATPENESLRDSFTDLLNYAAIAQLVIDGKWPAE